MKKPFTTLARIGLLALTLGGSLAARAQTYTPVTLTGFTEDVIANGTGAVSATTTADIDGGAAAPYTGYCLMAQNYVGPAGQVPNPTGYPAATFPALETSGLLTSALNSAVTYQLASLSAANALRLVAAGASGTLTFATPRTATELYVLGTSGNAASVLNLTVNFADGTSQAFTNQTIADWFAAGQPNVVREKLGRVSRADNAVQYTTGSATVVGPRLYQLRLALAATNLTKNITGVTITKPLAAGNAILMAVTAGSSPTCAAVPTGTSAVATTSSGGSTPLTSACAGTSIYLSLSGLPTNQAGLTFQWQTSANNSTWTDISGATSSTYTATGQTAATYYRAVVRCLYDGAGGTAAPSAAVQVTQNTLLNCYCTPTYSVGGNTDIVARVQLGTLDNNTSTLGNVAPYYHDYSTLQTGINPTLQTPTLFQGGSAAVTITFGSDSNQHGAVWIDFNQNGVLGDVANEFVATTSNAGANGVVTLTLPVPAGAVLGTTKMRIRGGDDTNDPTLGQACGASGSSYGEGEDYLVSVVAPTPCAGTPPAITAASTASTACTSATFTLSSTGVAAGTTGLTYQWQSRTGTAAFANISNATAATYTVASQTAATDYRLVVTCTASSQSATSNTVTVSQSNFLSCYVTPVVSTGTNEYIRSVNVNGASGFTNTTNASSTSGYGDFTGNAALTTTLNKGSSYPLTIIVQANNVGSQGALWIDYNHSGTFDAAEYFQFGSSSATATAVTFNVSLPVPNTTAVLTGATRMRLRWRNGSITASDAQVSGPTTWYGETEDYLVTLAQPLAATAAQNAPSLVLFPNPAHSAATLTGAEAGAPVQLLDALGRVVLTTKADATGQATLALPTGLAHGLYLVRTGTRTARLVLE